MLPLSRIVVLGAEGQIGSALVAKLGGRAIPLNRAAADLSKPAELIATLESLSPDALINAAAYTAVDAAEADEANCMAINAIAPKILAEWCAEKVIPFVDYSTDYVFDGCGEKPWRETDACQPLNVYGKSKLAGEQGVLAAGGESLIFRTSWVYDTRGKNFLTTMLRLGSEKEVIRVVSDQFGAPSYAAHLADATISCLDKAVEMESFPSGIYHMVNSGETSWHGFAEAIFAILSAEGVQLKIKDVEQISSLAYSTAAERPKNSRLNCSKLHTVFGERLPRWEQGLSAAMESLRASHRLSD